MPQRAWNPVQVSVLEDGVIARVAIDDNNVQSTERAPKTEFGSATSPNVDPSGPFGEPAEEGVRDYYPHARTA